MRKNIFCNNCGKQGHVYNQCRIPITSLGFIIFRKRNNTNENEYLLIRRKDSLGYVDFVRGNYSLNNKQHLLNLIEEMTNDEKEFLCNKNNTFTKIWRTMWGTSFQNSKNHHEENMSKKKFDKLREHGIMINSENITLRKLVDETNTSWKEPEWGFPKGRRNYQEKDLMCAFREFEEETGFHRNDLNVISNLTPYEEVYMGSNYKTYKHKYFLAYYNNRNTDIFSFQKSEVSKMQWMTYKEAMESIRPYSIERKNIIRKIETTLKEFPLVI